MICKSHIAFYEVVRKKPRGRARPQPRGTGVITTFAQSMGLLVSLAGEMTKEISLPKESQREIGGSDMSFNRCATDDGVEAKIIGYWETNSGIGTSVRRVLVTPPNSDSLNLGRL